MNDTTWNFWKKQSIFHIFFYSFIFHKNPNHFSKKTKKIKKIFIFNISFILVYSISMPVEHKVN